MTPFDEKEIDKIFSTDMEFAADLGETLQGSFISITSKKWDNIQIEQKVETSVTIMDEGPHCDLVNWRHFTTNWTKLKETQKSSFTAITYQNGETTRFPTVEMKKLQKAANKQCGQEWGDLVNKCKSPNDYPCGVGTSRYFIKVIGIDNVTGKKMTREITIRIPMGC
jgi:hypothetical protein